jgi:dihydroflavonol-4-reductase
VPLNFFVTGATGFIGSELVRQIRARGDAVTALVRPTSSPTRHEELQQLGVRSVEGDLSSDAALAEAVRDADLVIHLAALVKARQPSDYYQVNVDGTRRLVSALAELPDPPRAVLCSSLTAAGPTLNQAGESGPVSYYGRSKLAAEHAARDFADRVPLVIVRPPIVYGPGDTEFLPSILPMARLGIMLQAGRGQKLYSLIHVSDLCSALLAAAERAPTLSVDDQTAGLYTVSDGVEHSTEDICDALAHALGRRRLAIIPAPDAAVYVAAAGSELFARIRGTVPIFNRDKAREMRCSAWTCTTDRAASDLGFTARIPLRDGLVEFVCATNGHGR